MPVMGGQIGGSADDITRSHRPRRCNITTTKRDHHAPVQAGYRAPSPRHHDSTASCSTIRSPAPASLSTARGTTHTSMPVALQLAPAAHSFVSATQPSTMTIYSRINRQNPTHPATLFPSGLTDIHTYVRGNSRSRICATVQQTKRLVEVRSG